MDRKRVSPRPSLDVGAVRLARVVSVFAPATVANFGVGFDALGAALDGPGDVVTAWRVPEKGVHLASVTGDEGRLPRDPRKNTACVAAAAVVAEYGRRGGGLALALQKGLPLASGLGSSAASASAGALAAGLLLGVKDRTRLLRAVLLAENAADGSWHGDNAFASLLGGLVLVPSSDPDRLDPPVRLPFPDRLRLVLVHPDLELTTRRARRVLPRSVPLAVHVEHAARFAGLVSALAAGDLPRAGAFLSADGIVEPVRAPLVRGYARVVRAIERAGAYGWALAGAGPSLMALSEAAAEPGSVGRAAVEAWRRAGVSATARVHRIDPRGARAIPRSRP